MEIRTTNFTTFLDRIKEANRRKKAMKIRKSIHKEYLKNITKAVCFLWIAISVVSCKHHEEEYHRIG